MDLPLTIPYHVQSKLSLTESNKATKITVLILIVICMHWLTKEHTYLCTPEIRIHCTSTRQSGQKYPSHVFWHVISRLGANVPLDCKYTILKFESFLKLQYNTDKKFATARRRNI